MKTTVDIGFATSAEFVLLSLIACDTDCQMES